MAALTLGGLASGSRGQPPLRPRPEGAQRRESEGLGPATAVRGGLRRARTDRSRGLSAAAQVSAALGSIGSIPCDPSRLSVDSWAQPPPRPVRPGASRPDSVLAGSQRSVPRLCARQPAWLLPLELPLRLPLPPSWLLASHSLLLQINFAAEERGWGAGPRAQKRGWAPGARKAGNPELGWGRESGRSQRRNKIA